MRRLSTVVWVTLLVGSMATTGCVHRPRVLDLPVVAVRAGKPDLTAEDVRTAIVDAATRLRWTVREDRPGVILATRSEKSQVATVTITYQMSMYGLRYRDSTKLNYRRKPVSDMGGATHDPDYATIDETYNAWVRELDAGIREELAGLR